jgi:hypothetical protein
MKRVAILAFLVVASLGCGGGGDGDDEPAPAAYVVFKFAPVASTPTVAREWAPGYGGDAGVRADAGAAD